MTITQHAHIYGFHTSNFNFGDFFQEFLSIQPLLTKNVKIHINNPKGALLGKMHAKWQEYIKEPAAKDFVARKACTIALSEARGIHWNRIKCDERLGNCPEAVIGQATINLDSRVWKSLEKSLPKLYCIGLAEAHVMQESASSRILHEKKRYDSQLPNACSHEKPSTKGGNGKKTGSKSTTRFHECLASRKCMICARNMWAHVRRSTSESQRYEKMGQEIGFPCSQERREETSK